MKKVALLTWLPSWRAGTPALSVTPTRPCENDATVNPLQQTLVRTLLRPKEHIGGTDKVLSTHILRCRHILFYLSLQPVHQVTSSQEDVSSESKIPRRHGMICLYERMESGLQ